MKYKKLPLYLTIVQILVMELFALDLIEGTNDLLNSTLGFIVILCATLANIVMSFLVLNKYKRKYIIGLNILLHVCIGALSIFFIVFSIILSQPFTLF